MPRRSARGGLAAGDALYVGEDPELELQASGRAFIRADDDTPLALVNQGPDFIQFKITSGRVSPDLRTLPTEAREPSAPRQDRARVQESREIRNREEAPPRVMPQESWKKGREQEEVRGRE